jgi:fructose-1,6-bisphosphatase/inositol monophosphatase family enzyme
VSARTGAAVDRFAADARFARAIAEEAGRILFERYEHVEHIEHKSSKDVVTEVDHLSEALILDAIRRRFPGDGILAEESGSHPGAKAGSGADRAGDLARSLAHGRTWIIDPLDGTVNYANGLPLFCVSVGLVVDGRPAAGAVHDPMRGETFWASAEGPAMLGDRTITASSKDQLVDLVVHLSLGGRSVATRARAIRKAIRVSRNIGTSALAIAYIANGRFDGFIQSGGMSAWDVAAAGLIAERAGAVVTDMDGGPWFDVDRATRMFGILAAPPAHHAELLRLARQPDLVTRV